MPTLLDCPTCQHPVPVTEANRATAVECPYCAREFTAYHELGDTPAAKKSKDAKGAKAKSKRRRDDDDDDDDDEDGPKKPKRGAGGSGVLVIGVGAFGLLSVMAALGVTSYLIYTYDPNDYVSSSTSTSKPNTNSNTPQPRPGIQPTPNRPNISVPNNNNPFPDTDPGTPRPQPKPKATTFTLSPVPGPNQVISVPTWLPALGPKEIALSGKVDRVAVGGRGKYLVMHFKDRSELAVFDISTGTIVASIASIPEQLHLAAGSTKLVTLKEWAKELNVYSLPDLTPQETVNVEKDLIHPASGIAMGSNTNGPALVNNPFGEVRLLDISGSPKFLDGATERPTGNHGNFVRASADGRLFVCGNDREAASLLEKNKKWVAKSLGNGPLFPGPDGQTLYGEGRIINAADSRIIGTAAAPATWYVPAVHGNYFLKVSGVKDTAVPPKHQVMLSIHANRDPIKEVGKIGVLDETAKLVEWWGNDAKFPPLDQHLFLIPEAKLLLVIPASKDRIIARRVEIK